MYVTFFIAIPQFLDDFLGGAVFPLFPLLLEVSIEIFSSSDSFFIFVWSAYKAIIGILHLYRGVIDLAFFFFLVFLCLLTLCIWSVLYDTYFMHETSHGILIRIALIPWFDDSRIPIVSVSGSDTCLVSVNCVSCFLICLVIFS